MIRLTLRWSLRILLALIGLVVIYLGATAVQVWWRSLQSDPTDASAVVVMGAAQYNGVPSPDLRARLNEALSLWDRHDTHLIVLTGGRQPRDTYTEAQAGARYLENAGVPSGDIEQADGNDSWTNLADAAPILHRRDVKTILMVTDPFHEYRSQGIAAQLGFKSYPAPTEHSPIQGWAQLPYFAKEAVGVGLGRIIGYQHLDPLPFGIR